ncbi:hypothetical protein CDD81_3622 [Ophiocordyceps australis]|uniref:Uncharacterized protein n=1 Tax=Ophiocordyceps australis TaxID=1399860 RepID=A0A2C5Y675_9HYPO|nr:hypothetical protein CDD81_3622 [Ophiocordyceps australis]
MDPLLRNEAPSLLRRNSRLAFRVALDTHSLDIAASCHASAAWSSPSQCHISSPVINFGKLVQSLMDTPQANILVGPLADVPPLRPPCRPNLTSPISPSWPSCCHAVSPSEESDGRESERESFMAGIFMPDPCRTPYLSVPLPSTSLAGLGQLYLATTVCLLRPVGLASNVGIAMGAPLRVPSRCFSSVMSASKISAVQARQVYSWLSFESMLLSQSRLPSSPRAPPLPPLHRHQNR